MSDLSDFDLDKQPDDPQPTMRRAGGYGAGILLLLLAGGTGYYFYARSQTPEPAVPVTVESPSSAPNRPSGSVAPAEPSLPALTASDALARQLLEQVSSRPELASWLLTSDLVNVITLVVDQMAQGEVPIKALAFLAPSGTFSAIGSTDELRVDPASYTRYDAFGDLVASIDAGGTARAYARLRPLFAEAYRNLGHPDGDFDGAIDTAIGQVQGTPVIEGDIRLATRGGLYRYADDRLESASGVRRQILRMGPRNTNLIRSKAGELADALAAEPTQALRP